MIALDFVGSTSMPLVLMMNINSFPVDAPNMHFLGFNRNLNLHNQSNNLFKSIK